MPSFSSQSAISCIAAPPDRGFTLARPTSRPRRRSLSDKCLAEYTAGLSKLDHFPSAKWLFPDDASRISGSCRERVASGARGSLPRASPAIRARPALPVRARQPLEADQREMSERRHRAAFEQAHATVTLGPSRQTLPAEFRPPAESPRYRGKALLEDAARPGLGAEMVDEDDLAARLGHARKLVERRLGVGHRGDDVLRHHRVEESVGEAEMLRIHHRQRLHMGELVLRDPLVRLAQHRLAIVDADDAVRWRIVGQRDAGADPDVEDAPADALRRRDRGLAASVEHGAEDEIVDRRPARIGLGNRVDVDFARHRPRHVNSRYGSIARMKYNDEIRVQVPHFPRAARPVGDPMDIHMRSAPDTTRASRMSGTCVAATALWMKPPPSTRACPSAAS